MTDNNIRTLTTVDEAVAELKRVAADNDWVFVFWDRGWGDSGQQVEVSICANGNGALPFAYLTRDVYRDLVDRKIVEENSYGGYKARRIHDYKAPPVVEKTGPDAGDIAEQVIRDVFREMAGEPIRAEFFRGLTPGPRAQCIYDYAQTDAYSGTWFVLLCPGGDGIAMSAQEPTVLGPDIIGGGIADILAYPKTGGGDVDLDALAGREFRASLVDAIRGKLAIIADRRAEVNA